MNEFISRGRGGIDGPRVIQWKTKITICHRPPGDQADDRTMTIAYMSGFDHIAHGTAGACPA